MQLSEQASSKHSHDSDNLDYTISSKCSGGNCVGVARLADGSVKVRNTSDEANTPITFTREEWVAFVAGVKNDEFNVR